MAPEEALSIATLTFKVTQDALPILAVVGVGGLLIFSWIRAGSAHFLRERIWALLGGGKEFHDAYLNEQWKKVRDLETVRYRTGIRFQCRSKAAETFTWLEDHNISLDDLLKSKRYFDPREIQVRDPNIKAKKIASRVVTVLLLFMMALLIAFSLSSLALLTVKKTGTLMWTDGITARSWDLRSWKVTPDTCKGDAVAIENMHDRKVICELITTDTKTFIENSLNSQKYVGVGLVIFLMLGVVIIVRELDLARTAQSILEKTKDSRSRQENLDFS